MDRKYLPASLVVLVVGVTMILLPQNIEMHIAPERVTVWEDSASTEKLLREHVFTFDTGIQTLEDSSPYMEVWSDDTVTLNATFTLIENGTPTLVINITDNPSEFYIPVDDEAHVQVTGNVIEDQGTTVNAALYTLRPQPPECVTWYPYRFFGYGMTAIGAIASLGFYLKRDEKNKH